MSTNTTAAEIAAQILGCDGLDTGPEAHNLRALLLRIADGENWRDAASMGGDADAFIDGNRLRLNILDGGGSLTLLGREVAELLRALPWRLVLGDRDGDHDVAPACGDVLLTCYCEPVAKRIADLLTRDDLDKAKQYRTEPTT